jgi:hypothetical protein
MIISFSQNPLVVLKTKSVAIRFQQVVVPWLIAMFGMDYVSEATPDLLRQIIGAIVNQENIKGLSAIYDSLAERYPQDNPLTIDAVAEAAKYAAGIFYSRVAVLVVNTLTASAQNGQCAIITTWCATPWSLFWSRPERQRQWQKISRSCRLRQRYLAARPQAH